MPSLARLDHAHVWHPFTQMRDWLRRKPIVILSGRGALLQDARGREYLDANSSIWTNLHGHNHPKLNAAITRQLRKIAHSSALGLANEPASLLAEKLVEIANDRLPIADAPRPRSGSGHRQSPIGNRQLTKVFFSDDGATAMEVALKLAYEFARRARGLKRPRFLSLGGAYHGDTVGALSVGDDAFNGALFEPLRFPVLRAPGFDRPDCVKVAAELVRAHAEELAAVVVEPLVQGAAGMLTVAAEEFAQLGEACGQTGTLLVCDEVATGFGRTGALFASRRCGLRPDLLVLGKGLTGGYLPMSATVAADRVYRAFLGEDLGSRTLYHGHSYAGNALAAAVALEHLKLLQRADVLAGVAERSVWLRDLLHERIVPLPAVREVRLEGLMGGVDLEAGGHQRLGRRVCAAAVRRGVLLRPLGDTVVLVPPLTITAAELDRLVSVLRAAIVEVTGA